MNFFISKIKLWFRASGISPRTFDFYNDKVNVITGDSSTGKSSFLKIIDYCFLQERCNIVEDVINASVAWYGMLFYVDDMPYTIIRKAPNREAPEMVTIFRESEYLPEESPIANTDDQRSKVLPKLNKLFSISSRIKLNKNTSLCFRHYLLFNYLTEDIIATENTYHDVRFFKDPNYKHIEDDLFKLLIGIDEDKIRDLQGQIESQQHKISRNESKQKREKEEIDRFNMTKAEVLKEITSLGLCSKSKISENPEDWSLVLKSVIDNYKLQFTDVDAGKKRQEITDKLFDLKCNLENLESLEREYKSYCNRMIRHKDSLEPIIFIEKHMSEIFSYNESGLLLKKLKNAWSTLKASYDPHIELPLDFKNRKKEISEQIVRLENELSQLNPIPMQDKTTDWIRDVILVAEKIKRELQKEPTCSITEEVMIELHEEKTDLEEKLNKLKTRNDNAISKLNEHIDKYFQLQEGLSDSYADCSPKYNVERHSLLLNRPGWEYPIENVGSKSNYMFMHLCYFYGLHDLLKANKNKQILPFLFIDQPSIPYYADRRDKDTLKSDDEIKLLSAFKLTDQFMQEMKKNNEHFQIIMIEHADPRYWEERKFNSFRTCVQFNKENGLIPEYAIIK